MNRYESLDEEYESCIVKDDQPLLERLEEMKLQNEEQNEAVEELMISNDDLIRECRQLKEKLSETEVEMENLRAGKLREKENSNILASQLALSQV